MPLQRMTPGIRLRSLAYDWQLRLRAIREAHLRPTLALDLGSQNSRIALSSPGSPRIVVPSRIAVNLKSDSVVAVGLDALRMVDRVPQGVRIESPIRAGVIAHPNLAELLIRQLLRQTIGHRRLLRPDLVIAAPAGATSVQRHALVVVAYEAGARHVTLVQEGIAAALGADLPVLEPTGSLIVEIGAEKTEIAVASLGGIVVSATAPVGGAHMRDAIVSYLRQAHHLMIGLPSAEAIKLEIGSAMLSRIPTMTRVRGRDQVRGIPTLAEIKGDELVVPIQEVLHIIVEAIHSVLEKTPPELSADIADTGIHLSGGGSQLNGLPEFLEQTLRLPARIVDDPDTAVVRGCQRCASDPRLLQEVARLT